jgi:putative spermidine/putrescine transport system ATP-binding protein
MADAFVLSIRDVSKSFGATQVLDRISFEIVAGEFLTILGESGSGKTTLLRILAGFERCDQGEIWMDGERLDALPPNRRNVNMVFQHYALFPHLSVFENIAYGLRSKKVPTAELSSRVEAVLEQMKMMEFRPRRPAQLSGGQQQRVALARALVNRPRVLLLDEPLSALDANLRRHMQLELKALQREIGITFVFVTHDQEEAMTLSDRVVLLRKGKVEQLSTPHELYNQPRTQYAATFVGQTNLLRASVADGTIRVGSLVWPATALSRSGMFSLRPEHIKVAGEGVKPEGALRFTATVLRRVFIGSSELLEVQCDHDLRLLVRIPNGTVCLDKMTLDIAPQHFVPLTAE